jgi:hypothetical protein
MTSQVFSQILSCPRLCLLVSEILAELRLEPKPCSGAQKPRLSQVRTYRLDAARAQKFGSFLGNKLGNTLAVFCGFRSYPDVLRCT